MFYEFCFTYFSERKSYKETEHRGSLEMCFCRHYYSFLVLSLRWCCCAPPYADPDGSREVVDIPELIKREIFCCQCTRFLLLLDRHQITSEEHHLPVIR